MNTIANTERPKLKLNFGAKPLTLNTNANPVGIGPALKQVVVFEKPKESVATVGSASDHTSQKDEATGTTKTKSQDAKKSKEQKATASSKKIAATPKEILKSSNTISSKSEAIRENTVWNQIRKGLREELGEHIDQAWFSKAEATTCTETNTLILTMPTRFMADWVRNNYSHVIIRLSEGCGVKVVGYCCE